VPTLDDVSRIASQLPGTEERPSGGGRAWFVRKKPYAWESMPWPSQPEELRGIVSTELCVGVVVPDEESKRALLQGWPDVFIPWQTSWGGLKVIVRLGAIELDHLTELITESWYSQAPKYLHEQLGG
jgi:hypothetical protein